MAADIGAVGDRGLHTGSSGTGFTVRGIGKRRRNLKLLGALAVGLVVVIMVAFCFAASPGTVVPSKAYATSWIISTIDSARDVGSFPSLALDSEGCVHISYYDETHGHLKYATNAGGSWAISTIDSARDVGWSTSIALDLADKVHISYYDSTNGDLRYATNTDGSWAISTIDSTGDVGRSTSLAVDSDGYVHISYRDLTSFDLKYASNAGGSWTTSTIDSAGNVGSFCSLALDSSDCAHISYCELNVGDPLYGLKYATNTGGSWTTCMLDNTGDASRWTAIAVDSNDKPHISYRIGDGYLKYGTNASGTWTFSIIVFPVTIGMTTSIDLDSSNNIHISSADSERGLKYVTKGERSWEISAVDDPVRSSYASLEVDSGDFVHIVYQDDDNRDLKYAVSTELIPEFGPHMVSLIVASTLVIFIALNRRHKLRHEEQQVRGEGNVI